MISGDLSQAVGMPVTRGQELMTLAPDRRFRVVAEADEQDVSALREGQRAQVLAAVEGTALAYAEDQAATTITATITAGDVDNASRTGATILITGNYANGQDVLAFVDQNGITGSWDAASGTLTLSGTATLAQYQAALRSVTYRNTSDTPSTAVRTVSFTVSDGAASSNTATRSITVTAVSDAPTSADKTITIDEGTAYTFTVADFGFSDPNDSPANSLLAVTITTLPGGGSLTLNGVAVGEGQSVAAADIGAGLLRFTPDGNASGAGYASFTFQVQDDGGTAGGGADLDPVAKTLTVDVNPVNDAPLRTAGTVADLTVPEDAAATSLRLGALAYGPGGGGYESGQTLTYTVTAVPPAALGNVTLADGVTVVTANTSYTLAQVQGMQFLAAANANGGPATSAGR